MPELSPHIRARAEELGVLPPPKELEALTEYDVYRRIREEEFHRREYKRYRREYHWWLLAVVVSLVSACAEWYMALVK